MASPDQESLQAQVDALLTQMRDELGVSERFIEQSRPIIERLFGTVPPERREACLRNVRATFAQQAEIEDTVRRLRAKLDALSERPSSYPETLN